MDEVLQQRDAGDIFEHALVGDHGGVEFVSELVEDDAGAGEAHGADGVEGEQDVIECAETVGGDENHRQVEIFREIGDAVICGKRDSPAAHAFNDHA